MGGRSVCLTTAFVCPIGLVTAAAFTVVRPVARPLVGVGDRGSSRARDLRRESFRDASQEFRPLARLTSMTTSWITEGWPAVAGRALWGSLLLPAFMVLLDWLSGWAREYPLCHTTRMIVSKAPRRTAVIGGTRRLGGAVSAHGVAGGPARRSPAATSMDPAREIQGR